MLTGLPDVMNVVRTLLNKFRGAGGEEDRGRLRRRILTLLEEHGVTGRETLLEHLRVEKAQLQQALEELEEEGLLQITAHGGAVLQQYNEERPFDQRVSIDEKLKQALARLAVERYCPRSGAVSLHGSSSVMQMIPFMRGYDLQIHTNSLLFASYAREAGIESVVLVSGGRLRFVSGNLIGQRALEYFQGVTSQVAFVGAHGITPELVFKDPIAEEVAVKRQLMESADKVVLLVDSTKFGSDSLLEIGRPEDVDVVITDDAASPKMVKGLRERGVTVELVECG